MSRFAKGGVLPAGAFETSDRIPIILDTGCRLVLSDEQRRNARDLLRRINNGEFIGKDYAR